jgi:hypothetical protein
MLKLHVLLLLLLLGHAAAGGGLVRHVTLVGVTRVGVQGAV